MASTDATSPGKTNTGAPSPAKPGPVVHVRDLRVSADYGQIYIYSPEVLRQDSESEAYLDALAGRGRSRG
jgi:hypothetical protein